MTHARLATVVVLSVAGCVTHVPATEVIVFVDAEPGVRTATASLEVRVEGSTGRGTADFAPRELSTVASPRWPVHIAVSPLDGDGQRVYRVTATAQDGTARTPALVAQVRVISGYRPGHSVRIDLLLQDACIHHPACPVDQTCVGGNCVTAMVDPATLAPLDGDAGHVDAASTPDAGVDAPLDRDAGSADAGLDAGMCSVTAEATLVAPGGHMGDDFGRSVASLDEYRAIVGADNDTSMAGIVGSARIFVRSGSTWTQETALHGSAIAGFGWSVAMGAGGARVVVGTRGGPLRAFTASPGPIWTEDAPLVASATPVPPQYGYAVAINAADGTRALVGQPGDATTAGSVYVFVRTGTQTWAQEAMLNGVANSGFGVAVALSADGSRALIGAVLQDAAYVFARNGTAWGQESLLLASDGTGPDEYGRAVALSADGSIALIGAPRDTAAAGIQAGEANVFVRTGTTWTYQATLVASTGTAHDQFGYSVSLSADGTRALIGAFAPERAWLFLRNGTAWREAATLSPAHGVVGDGFGRAVALTANGTRALVGAPGGGPAGTGEAFVFVLCAP